MAFTLFLYYSVQIFIIDVYCSLIFKTNFKLKVIGRVDRIRPVLVHAQEQMGTRRPTQLRAKWADFF